jgi:hypothetical protein
MQLKCATFIAFAACAMPGMEAQAGILSILAKGAKVAEHEAPIAEKATTKAAATFETTGVKIEKPGINSEITGIKIDKPGVNIENGVKIENRGKQSLALGGGGGGEASSSGSQSSGEWTWVIGPILAFLAIGFHWLSRLRSAASV